MFDKMDILSASNPDKMFASLDAIRYPLQPSNDFKPRKMNTPSFEKVSTSSSSGPATPIPDIPSLLDLPSALTTSSHPLRLNPTPKYNYELPDLTTRSPSPQGEMSSEVILPPTNPLKVHSHVVDAAPGIHVRVIQLEPDDGTIEDPKIEIILDIEAGAPSVRMDVRAKKVGECFVRVHKQTSQDKTGMGIQTGTSWLGMESEQVVNSGELDSGELEGSSVSWDSDAVVSGCPCVGKGGTGVGVVGGCCCQPPCQGCIDHGCRGTCAGYGIEDGPRGL
jgi:hypothetical protein